MTERTSSPCSSNQDSVAPRPLLQLHPQPPSNAPRRLPVARLAFACVALCSTAASSQEIEYRPLPELVASGASAFTRGDFPQAAATFNYIAEAYREEPQWTDSPLPEKLLPLAGFASLKSGLYAEATLALETYLADHASNQDTATFARYALAVSLYRNEETDKAKAAFAALRQQAQGTAFHDLAAIREAKLSSSEDAIALLSQIVETPVSHRLATQARLELIRRYSEGDDPENARRHLLDTDWKRTTMPELATLSFLAFRLGDQLLEGNPRAALRAYQLVSPKAQLIDAQEERLAGLKQTVSKLAPTLSNEQSIWTDFYRDTIRSLESQLETLRQTPDYADTLELRKARCFAALNRPLEAWLLLEHLSLGPSDLAPAAHLEWIGVARQMKSWNAAALIAQEFLTQYPKSEDAQVALYWIAQSQMDQGSYPAALASLAALLQRSEDPEVAASAHYFSGYCHYQLRDFANARLSFEQTAAIAHPGSLAGQALLWIGICDFTTNDTERALATFAQVEASPDWPVLHAEAAYRKAACHYAMGENASALAAIETWLERYPNHAREAEAHLLHGDLLRDGGQLEAAIAAYARVPSELRELRFFALSNQAELYGELDRWPEAAKTVAAYSMTAPPPPSLVGPFYALYAQCLEVAGESEHAASTLAQAIDAHGNDLAAEGILLLIEQSRRFTAEQLPELVRSAEKAERYTLASRYTLALARLLAQQNRVSESKLQKLRLVSDFALQDLPPLALVAAGEALNEIGSLEAPAYFERAIETFPDSEAAPLAFLGLAHYHSERSEPRRALALLRRLEIGVLPPESAVRSKLLRAKLEQEQGLLDSATTSYQDLLANRAAPPSAKAQALFGLGAIKRATDRPLDAYAFYQRIFTLYRGEAALVASAYLACAEILYSMDRYEDAENVCREFLAQADLSAFPAYGETESLLEEIQPLLHASPSTP